MTLSPTEAYGVNHWGADYFSIHSDGTLHVHPFRTADSQALDEVVHAAATQGLHTPLLIRFPDILIDRVSMLYDAFSQALERQQSCANYTAVFPIKVNQQRDVVTALLSHPQYNIGLEVGSKPELLVALATMRHQHGIIICNGYKDRHYLRYALLGQAMGHDVTIIIEKLSELRLLLREAEYLAITPQIGVRVRLASLGKGKWQNTGGDKAKFGLSSEQVLHAIRLLQQQNSLSCLQLMHFHMGSQIANIRDIQTGLHEAARFYQAIQDLGAPLRNVDVGGGLGVDYEGNCSRAACSMNYTVQEYADNVVKIFASVCRENNQPCPNIFTEAGRAMVAHHAILVVNSIDRESPPNCSDIPPPQPEDSILLHDLWQVYESKTSTAPIESYHEAQHVLREAQLTFNQGRLNLSERAAIETMTCAVLQKLQKHLNPHIRAHKELLDELKERLASKYFLNFSVFQSTPDVWAIGQIFPIIPLSQLHTPLTERGIIQDLTCDSDGRIDDYIDAQNIESSMRLPAFDPNQPYLFGLFLLGAYQETLGDIHNLFGDTDSINAYWQADTQKFALFKPKRGDSASDVLAAVGYSSQKMSQAFAKKLQHTQLAPELRQHYLNILCQGLSASTYLLVGQKNNS